MSTRKARPYLFYGQTQSLCPDCMAVIPAKIVFQDDCVWYLKRCAEHGTSRVLISTDIDYYKRCREYIKPGDLPALFHTRIERGCPHDCGLCPDHEQHSCLAIFDIIDECNLRCPVCFADSGPGHGGARSMDEIESMLATLLRTEREPDLVQVSGGEPTLHPRILEILRRLKATPIRHLMLNTNGLRIAREPEFVAELATLRPGFEVYLQFDSLRPEALRTLRAADLAEVRMQALRNLEAANISTTMMCVVRRGSNDDEMNELIAFARQWRCVRGITFQPVEDAGRNTAGGPEQRVTVSEIRRRIIDGDNPFADQDLVPLPCHPENICVAYAYRDVDELIPVTRHLQREDLLAGAENAITFETNPELRKQFLRVFSLDACADKGAEELQGLLCCLPQIDAPNLTYADVFRIVIMGFMDAHDFCISAIKRSCVHFVEPDGKVYPFETFNLIYRDRRRRARAALAAGI